MASFKNSKNLLQQSGEYARYFDNLRGVDFSSDQTEVLDSRFAYLVNMYRDYKSGQGGCVETIPGFRLIRDFGAHINGIHIGNNNIFVHIGSWLYWTGIINEDGVAEIFEDEKTVVSGTTLSNEKTVSFFYEDFLYILGGGSYFRIEYDEEGYPNAVNIKDIAYLPTTWTHIDPEAQRDSDPEDTGDGKEFEQRNLLNPRYRSTFIADGAVGYFELKEPIDCSWSFEGNTNALPQFSPEFDVYQYGIRLPLAYNDGKGIPRVPQGYPNAIQTVVKEGSDIGNGQIWLVNIPPRPEHNTWNPEKDGIGGFDYSSSDIDAGVPESEGYNWPFAFPKKHPGIEITVTKKIENVGGIKNPQYDQASIISNCRLATLYDNHVFLSGNPDYPRHVFYNVIRADNGGTPDATFFGQLNMQLEGTSNSPVVSMMSVGDSLLVMKKDSDEEESLVIHTPEIGTTDIMPIKYPSERGLKGIGCYGPCYNFRDDPVFISKFGLDALGHVSTKYRRAIKHRSSMVDAKLLNCNLQNASITEWGGYLMILVEGKVFMADSRQMYNTEGNSAEYEWYYLEDIGVYENQFDEYVYAEFTKVMTKEELLEITGGVDIVEAQKVRDEYGIERHLIGTLAFENENEITYITVGDDLIYYKELDEFDEYGNKTGRSIKYYVEPSGGKTGGEFDPAVMIKTIGDDLFFTTKKGSLCKFNFDKRDPETGLIPPEYYDFNGRTIFSGCATKMDNCGIPHLTKSTVKRSTVIKTRTFKYSGMKVKVRTNRNAFNQISRIVNGQATFDDPDFNEYTFNITDKSIFSVNEKEKKWVEKQIFIYSDEFRRPFAVHYLAYRYTIAGRYKE